MLRDQRDAATIGLKKMDKFDFGAPGASDNTIAPPTTEPLNGAGRVSDPFDPSEFLLDQSFMDGITKQVLTSLPVDKPHPNDFVRAHLDPAFHYPRVGIYESDFRTKYLLIPQVAAVFQVRKVKFEIGSLTLAVTDGGKLFLWFAKEPRDDGSFGDSWNLSMAAALQIAKTKWVRVYSHNASSKYLVSSVGDVPMDEPIWPEDLTMSAAIALAFDEEHQIKSLDHPLVKRFMGKDL
jgi:hypothetical protein